MASGKCLREEGEPACHTGRKPRLRVAVDPFAFVPSTDRREPIIALAPQKRT